jgi:replicative DNA helicase
MSFIQYSINNTIGKDVNNMNNDEIIKETDIGYCTLRKLANILFDEIEQEYQITNQNLTIDTDFKDAYLSGMRKAQLIILEKCS